MAYSSVNWAINLELTQGINSALPVGIESFGSDASALQLNQIIKNDLSMTGQFKLLTSNAPSISTWRALGADSVISGHLTRISGNRYALHLELTDVAVKGRVLLAKEYQVNASDIRRLAHHVSDEIVYQLTGERGIFSTRIAYVLVRRDYNRTRYSLEIAEVDGNNPQSLLVSTDPIMSPAWSPDGRQIAYVSFEKRRAQIFTVDVATGQRRLLTDFPGINGAPAWSPDGRQLAVVLSKGGSPKIYLLSLANGTMKQLTYGEAIDTEPRFSPDGTSILFTSGRGGSPQVYKLTLATGAITRITYDGNYNAKASYTPNQHHMVMLHREDRTFNLGVLRVGSSAITPLTYSSNDESPSISPNGRLVLYATHERDKGVLALVSLDGRARMLYPARDGDVQEPAWSPYLA
jgi:TolB protein